MPGLHVESPVLVHTAWPQQFSEALVAVSMAPLTLCPEKPVLLDDTSTSNSNCSLSPLDHGHNGFRVPSQWNLGK